MGIDRFGQISKDAPSILAPMVTHLNKENAKLKARVAELEDKLVSMVIRGESTPSGKGESDG